MKQRIRGLLPRNKFARSVSVLAGGTAAGQIIVVAASPILTRLYSPEDFGLLAVFAGLLAILAVIASLRYQLAIPLPESDEEAASVTVLSLLVVLGMTLLSTVIITIWGETLAGLLNTTELAPYFWLLPLGVLVTGIYEVFNYWAIRTKGFTAIARTKLTRAGTMVGVQIGGYALGPLALLLGQVAGQAVGSASLGALTLRRQKSAFKHVRAANVRGAASRFRRFPLYSSWGSAFNTISTQLPFVLFAGLFSPAVAGIYVLAHRVVAMPMQLVGKAIADTFYASAAEARRSNRLKALVADIQEALAHIAMPPALMLLLAGPDLFEFVFGASWRQAGVFSQWLAPWLYLQFVTSPLSQLFAILEKQIQGLLFQGILLITRVSAIIIGAYYGSVALGIALFGLGSAMCFVGLLIMLARVSGNSVQIILMSTLNALVISTFILSPLLLFYMFTETEVMWLSAVAASLILVACRYVFFFRQRDSRT